MQYVQFKKLASTICWMQTELARLLLQHHVAVCAASSCVLCVLTHTSAGASRPLRTSDST
jgi:hypothetical protein